MDGLLHQVLEAAGSLQIVGVFRIYDFKQDFLDVRLVRLVLHDLAELNSINFGRHEALKLIE